MNAKVITLLWITLTHPNASEHLPSSHLKYRKATMTYTAINGKAPDYISAMFRYVSDVHKRTTRQTCNKDLYIPSKAKLNVFKNTLRYSGAYIWNNLPAKVNNVSSVEMFKTSYLNMYFS